MATPTSDRSSSQLPVQLGEEVKRLRLAANLTQQALADRVYYSRSYIALIETGRERPSREAIERIAKALNADPVPLRTSRSQDNALARLSTSTALGDLTTHLLVGSGPIFRGAVVALVPFEQDVQPQGLQRTLAVVARDGVQYAIDAREVPRRSLKAVPRAYRVDDFTYAILSAVANLDDALLSDDTSLAEARSAVTSYEQLNGSAVSRDIVRGLNELSQMWLGSNFCVRHILRNVGDLGEPPVFWTAEKRGEEGANWLLFKHKYQYMQEVRRRFGSTTRLFCIPEEAVRESPRYERVLMLLSAALMESLDITVHITSDPAYGATGGFVLSQDNQAIVANWLHSEGIWHVDRTSRGAIVSEMKEVAGHGAAHSIINASTSKSRLQAMTAYLELDWDWLVRRAAQIAAEGVNGFVSPRSRLLSMDGITAALSHLQSFAPPPPPRDQEDTNAQ